jgi:hypothetical protein
MKFLTQMRDGKPKQQLAVDDARKAREESEALVQYMSDVELAALLLDLPKKELEEMHQPPAALGARPYETSKAG